MIVNYLTSEMINIAGRFIINGYWEAPEYVDYNTPIVFIYNYGNHTLEIYANGGMPEFIGALRKYFDRSKAKKKIISIIQLWCSENEFINSLSPDDRVSPLEILYKTHLTRPIFNPVKLHPPARDWFSLSTYETYEINISYLNYVETLDHTQLHDLHRQLSATAKQLIKKLTGTGERPK